MTKIVRYGKLHGRVSPLANNRELYKSLKDISIDRGVEFGLMVWISYRESHIGTNFAPGQYCSKSNNRSWLKRSKDRNGELSVKYDTQYKLDGRDDLKWCWLYAFDNVEEYRRSFANFLYHGYIKKDCGSPECISKYYVKNDWVVKTWRSRSVNMFRNN